MFKNKKNLKIQKIIIQMIKNEEIIKSLYKKKIINKQTRDKETYWLQRYSLGKVETD